jgi:hypothetical protein
MPEPMTEAGAGSELVDIARAGLLEITPPSTVGELLSQQTDDDGVVTLLFQATMLGYPGWHWTVSVARLDGEEPTVLEAELLPGDGALLAPDWVPWADRLEDYKAAQAAIAAGELSESDDDGDDDDSEDDDDLDDDDDDEDDDDDDDDHGDDPDDGIDFESDDPDPDDADALAELPIEEAFDGELAVPASVGDDEQDQPDAQADEDGPEPPAASVRQKRSQEEQ